MLDIVCLGEVLIDMFALEVGRPLVEASAFRPVPGGAPANVAVASARLGAQSAFIGKVGDDPFGHYLADTLARQGVETRGIRFDAEARTGLNFHAQVDEHTATHLFYRNPSADMHLRPAELDRSLLQTTRCYHFSSISLSAQPSRDATIAALHIAHDAGAMISFDVNYRPGLWQGPDAAREQIIPVISLANVLKINHDELLLLTGSTNLEASTRQLRQQGPELCVVTLGPDGCFYASEQGNANIPGFIVQSVDATGCGDAFTAALLVQLVTGEHPWRANLTPASLNTILRKANAAGALTSLSQGVFPALPTTTAVDSFLAQHTDHL